ncbi:MAG: hypothetical protein ABWK53_04030 [Anaerolineales bacterium]
MKKTFIVVALLAVLLTGVGVGQAAAQGETPPRGNGVCGGVLHPYMVAAFADRLNLSVEQVESALVAGQTLYQIALANGVSAEAFPALMSEVRQAAIQAALADGVITQQQADRMLAGGPGRGRGGMMGGAGRGTCGGTGMPRGWRWQTTNP